MLHYPRSNRDGSLLMEVTYKYDSNGNNVEASVYQYDRDSNKSLTNKSIYKYNSDGNKIKRSLYNSDGLFESNTIYKYNSDGNLIEESRYASDEKMITKIIYIYSENRLVEDMYYHTDNKFGEYQENPRSKTTYEYEEY